MSGGNFLTVALCAHYLPLNEQGKLTYVIACYMALLLFNVSAIFQGASVRAPAENNKEKYLFSLAGIQVIFALKGTAIVLGLLFLFGGKISWGLTFYEGFLTFIFLMLQQLADFDRRIAYVFHESSLSFLSSAAVYPLRICLIALIRPEEILIVLVILSITSVVPAIKTIRRGLEGLSFRDSFREMKEHLIFSRLLIVSAPLGWLWSYIPIFMLGLIYSTKEVAIVASIRSLTNVANILMEQIDTVAAAKLGRTLYEEGKEGLDLITRQLLTLGITVWLVGLILIYVYGKKIVFLVLGDKYSEHYLILMISWLAYGIHFVARVLGLKQRIFRNMMVEFIGNGSGVLVMLALSYAVIISGGVYGAAWMYVICAFSILLSQLLMIKRISTAGNGFLRL